MNMRTNGTPGPRKAGMRWWVRTVARMGGSTWPRRSLSLSMLAGVMLSCLAGCGDATARREDARVLAEFRGPYYLSVAQRRPSPTGPPLVPHVIYRENFDCMVCHAHEGFRFRGQRVPLCTHPDRAACLQCHVALQTDAQPFQFEMLGQGAAVAQAVKTASPQSVATP